MSKLSAGAGAWSPTSFNPTAEEPTPPGGAPTAADAQPTDADPAAEPAAEAAAAEPAAEAATEAATEARTEAATDEEDWETAEVAPLPDKDEDDEGDSAPAVAAAQEDRRPADDDDAVLGVASANAIFEDEAGAWGDSDDDGDGGGYAPRVVEDYAARAATPPADEGWEDAPVKTKSRSRLGPQQAQAEPPAQTSSRYDAAPRELQSRDSAPRELSSRSGGGGGGGGYGNGGMKPKSKEYVKPSWAQVGDADRSATVLKKAKALLNKLTVEKFERLSCEFIAIDFFSEPLVQGAIDMIVDKAQQETHFVDIYAELCVKMAGTPLPGLGEDADAKGKKFRQMLLERCQAEFEKDHTDLQAELELMEEAQRNRQLNAIRKAYIGHMIFVGALYTEDLLKERVLHHCIQELFGEGVDAPDDEKIECLTRLLTKTGKSLDLAALENPKSQKLLKAYFKQLQKLKKSPLLSSRIRFLVRDLCDLRDANWKPRREEDKAKTIEEIHDDAQREADQKAGIKTKKKKPEDDKKKLAADDGRIAEDKPKKAASAPSAPAAANSFGGFGALSSKDKDKKKKKKEKEVAAEPEKVKPKKKKVAVSEEAPAGFDAALYKSKSKSAISEYLSIETIAEVLSVLNDELKAAPKTMRSIFVAEALDVVLNAKAADRSKIPGLLVELLQHKVLDNASVSVAFLETLEFLPDIVVDTPKASEWLGDVLKTLAAAGVPLAFLDAPPPPALEGEDALAIWAQFKAYVAKA